MVETNGPKSQEQELDDFKQWVTDTCNKLESLSKSTHLSGLSKDQLNEAQVLVNEVEKQFSFLSNVKNLTDDIKLVWSVNRLLIYTERVTDAIQKKVNEISRAEKIAEVQATVQTILQPFRNENIFHTPSASDTFADGSKFTVGPDDKLSGTDFYKMVNADKIIQRVGEQDWLWINHSDPPTEEEIEDYLRRLSSDIQIKVHDQAMYPSTRYDLGYKLDVYSDDLLELVEQQRANKSVL